MPTKEGGLKYEPGWLDFFGGGLEISSLVEGKFPPAKRFTGIHLKNLVYNICSVCFQTHSGSLLSTYIIVIR